MSVFFSRLEKFSAFISSNILPAHFSLSSPGIPIVRIRALDIIPEVSYTILIKIFFFHFSFLLR